MNLDRIATFACQKPRKDGSKNPQCTCEPCAARREIFGSNIPVQIQEPRRTRFAAGELSSLKDGHLDHL